MKLGVTGSRNGLTIRQRQEVMRRLGELGPVLKELHHGCCVGADFLIHQLAQWLDLPMVLHPPTDTRLVAPLLLREGSKIEHRDPLPYLERNRAIVDETTHLLVLPEGPEVQRSGTWSTYRYAKSKNKPVSVLSPDGEWI